ncbi:carboxyl transferase domain-containing protein [Nocardioides sp.]|uniref:acyl-CoA carboxylase subunit beta n=1 Tax=Nocardioides sp. TaxID=35761 RepID=UPI0026036DCD|nr:carboxyl transferase domain-containing protein [Nocardioides sp.]MDI6912329.1 carboxyl transferase domain-containing protein [Nocardioides sp.]
MSGSPVAVLASEETSLALSRAEQLSDPGAFHELFPLRRRPNYAPGASRADGDGVVVGVGMIQGRRAMIISHDFAHLGGSIGATFASKIARAQEMAISTGYPIVYLNDSGGARIQEGIEALHGCGEIFARNVLAQDRVPQISVILGPCAGAAAYSPALTDWTIMLRGRGQMFLTGPDIVKAATGETVTSEEIGGALLHTRESGVAHFDVGDEGEAFALVRRLLGYWPSTCAGELPRAPSLDPPLDAEALLPGVVPAAPGLAFDMNDVLLGILDADSWQPLMSRYGRSALCGFGRLDGVPVGVVASQPRYKGGILDFDSSQKVARFVNFCGRFGLPIVTFVDVPGFMPGSTEERRGVITAGAQVLAAYVRADVPKLTTIVRKAYGGSYIALGSRSLGADLTWAWRGAEVAVMGPSAAVGLLNRRQLRDSENPEKLRAEMTERYRHEVTRPCLAAAHGIIDDVIDAHETRTRLIAGLQMLMNPARMHTANQEAR